MVRVKAIFDYHGTEGHEIRFSKGDTFELVDDHDPNWWHVTIARAGEQIPEHIYVPATYVVRIKDGNDKIEDVNDNFVDDLPPPPTDEELIAISTPDPEPPASDIWRTHQDSCGQTYYFNTVTQTSQWNMPAELMMASGFAAKKEEQIYASLLPKKSADDLRKPVAAASAVERRVYQNMDYNSDSQYMNIDGASARSLNLQTAGQTTCNETTQQGRKHTTPPNTTPNLTVDNDPNLGKQRTISGGENVNPKRSTSPRPHSMAHTLPASVSPVYRKPLLKRQLSDNTLQPKSSSIALGRRSLKTHVPRSPSKHIREETMNESVVTRTTEHGNSSFHDNSVTISAPMPSHIPKQILDGYTQERIGEDYFYICKSTNEKWKLIDNDKPHYENRRTGERVWTLPVIGQAVGRTFSHGPKKPPKGLEKRSKSLSDYGHVKDSSQSPVVKCEGMLKRKITHAPAEVKCEKSWTPLFTVLKANTLFFYKDSKHYRRNEPESACELTETAQILSEHDRKGFKLIKIQKDNGLEMLLKVKDEAGTRSSSFDSWLEQLTSSAGGPTQGMRSSHSTSHLENMDYDGDVDIRSIIGNKEITKKDINEFLKRRETANQLNKSCIQQMLDEQGIDISHLDKSKKKEVLNKLLSARPSVGDLEKRGLIKYTVFQCPLAKLCSRQKVQVPKVVTQCIEAIEHRGLKSSGIYRINGNNASITKLRYKVDREEAVNLKDQEYDINILTGFMKLFLRELPEPVIPWNQYPIVERAIRDGDAGIGDPVTAIKQVVQNLPEPNKSTLIYIILHLVRVANEENQMDEHNLSIIFGPSLLGNHPERRNLLADLPVQNKAIELIISNYKTIFTFR